MSWCNYLIDKKHRIAIPLGKMDKDSFNIKVSIVEDLYSMTVKLNLTYDEDENILTKSVHQLTLYDVNRLVESYKISKILAEEDLYKFHFMAIYYYLVQRENNNVCVFYSGDEYAKDVLSGIKYTMLEH